jgi:hypothetical protein
VPDGSRSGKRVLRSSRTRRQAPHAGRTAAHMWHPDRKWGLRQLCPRWAPASADNRSHGEHVIAATSLAAWTRGAAVAAGAASGIRQRPSAGSVLLLPQQNSGLAIVVGRCPCHVDIPKQVEFPVCRRLAPVMSVITRFVYRGVGYPMLVDGPPYQ